MKKNWPRRTAGYLFAIVFILGGWLATALIVNSPSLPTPQAAFEALFANIERIAPYFGTSLVRVVASLVLGTLIAVPIAQICARSGMLDALFAPVLYLLYPIPKVVFLPVLLVILGLGGAPKILLVALTVFFQVLVAVRDAVRAIPESARLAVFALGGSRFDEFRHVTMPATLPGVFTSLRIGTGTAIAVLFIAEAMAGSTGLGYLIMNAWGSVDYPQMFAGIIAMSLMGLILYAAFDIIERRLTRWQKNA